MKVFGIIGAMDIEIQLIKGNMIITNKKQYAGFTFFEGKYKDLDIVLTSCGVGKVNASSCTQILIDKFNVTEIINTGIAGSLNEKVKLCDIVISDNVTYHDVRQVQMKSCFPFKEFFTANEQLKRIAINAYENCMFENHQYHIGRIVTGEAFISDNADSNATINYDEFEAIAANNSAKLVLSMLDLMSTYINESGENL